MQRTAKSQFSRKHLGIGSTLPIVDLTVPVIGVWTLSLGASTSEIDSTLPIVDTNKKRRTRRLFGEKSGSEP